MSVLNRISMALLLVPVLALPLTAKADTEASTAVASSQQDQQLEQAKQLQQERQLQQEKEQQQAKQLQQEIRQFVNDDRAEQRARLQAFRQDKTQQEKLLAAAKQRLAKADAEQARLKALFDNNEEQLAELETLLKQRTGQLGEVFGVAKEQSAELKQQLQASLVSAQYPQRAESLNFASEKSVPTMEQLETLWFQLQHEITHSGKISRFQADVADTDGRIQRQPVLRVGTFNSITEKGEFLSWQPDRQQLSVLAGQPADKFQSQAVGFFEGKKQHLLVDVSAGQLLGLIGQKPTLMDQVRQGGSVGYIILALGVLGLATAIYKLIRLNMIRHKINQQLKSDQPKMDNPLGRVLQACLQPIEQARAKHQAPDLEQLNSHLDEALLKELPALESGQSLLKLLAASAPLLGLLGTVTGMIGTFQSITLFGTSDPKLMAGGISQALITTVFGLVVAIPMLFSHGLLSSQSRSLLLILQEKSLAQLNQLTPWLLSSNAQAADVASPKAGSGSPQAPSAKEAADALA